MAKRRAKLYVAFFALLVIMGLVGTGGVFYTRKIQILLHQTTPLIRTSTELKNSLIAYLTLFSAKNEQHLQERISILDTLQQNFQATHAQLIQIRAEAGIQDETFLNEQEVFQQARDSIAAYQQLLQFQQHVDLEQQITAFQQQRQQLDAVLEELANFGEANINQSEMIIP
jgi:hypothetical protein